MRIAAFPAKIARLGRCGWLQRGVCLALAEMLLDPLTVEAGEDGRWRHAPFPGDADAPAQNIDLPDRMGVRIDAHEASGRQRSSEAQCIFGSAFTNAPHPAAKRAVKSSGLGGDVADARTHCLALGARSARSSGRPSRCSAVQRYSYRRGSPTRRSRGRGRACSRIWASLAPAFRVRLRDSSPWDYTANRGGCGTRTGARWTAGVQHCPGTAKFRPLQVRS